MIPNKQIELDKVFLSDPVKSIFSGAMIVREAPLDIRVELLAELIQKLNKLHEQGEATFGRNTFMGLGSSFAMAAAVATSSALNPFAGMMLSGAAVVSWGGAMYEVFCENTKLEPVKDKLQRLSLALQSVDDIRKWAALWQLSGDELFVVAVEEASEGHVSGGKLIRLDKNTPLQRAIEIVARFKGQTYDNIVIQARSIMEGKQPQMAPNFAPQPAPASLRSDTSFHSTAFQMPTAAPTRLPEPIDTIAPPVAVEIVPKAFDTPLEVLQQAPIGTETLMNVRSGKDIVDLILASVDSLAFIGGQRCGKSLLMAISSRIGLSIGKFNKVFVVSSLAKKGEDDHYWAHCEIQTFYDLALVVDKTPQYEEFLNTIRVFKKTSNPQNPQLLILDEFPYLCERLEDDIKEGNQVAADLMKEIANIGSVVASGGAKRGWHIWLGSPQGAIGDMGRGGKVMKMFKLCFCGVAPGLTVESNGVHVRWDTKLFTATKLNFKELKEPARGIAEDLSDRIVFFNDKWHEKTQHNLEDLPVGTQVTKAITPASVIAQDALLPQERSQLRVATAVQLGNESKQALMLIQKLENSESATLEGFIVRELKRPDKLEEMLRVIPVVLERCGRLDLLGKFQDQKA